MCSSSGLHAYFVVAAGEQRNRNQILAVVGKMDKKTPVEKGGET